MRIDPFGLERWFAEYEHEADIMLAESGIRSLDASRFDLDPGKLGYVIPTNGDPEFRAAVGDRYDRSADEVLFTCGTQEANFLTFLSLLGDEAAVDGGGDAASPEGVGSGTHAVVVTPTYQALHAVPDAFGDVTRVELEPPEWELDPEAIADGRPELGVAVRRADDGRGRRRLHRHVRRQLPVHGAARPAGRKRRRRRRAGGVRRRARPVVLF